MESSLCGVQGRIWRAKSVFEGVDGIAVPYADMGIVLQPDENSQVTELKDGGFLTIFHSFGDQEIAYSISVDGINWNPEVRIKVQSDENLWADMGDHAMRTPLCGVEEDNGTFTIIYSALMNLDGEIFYAIGKCSMAWEIF